MSIKISQMNEIISYPTNDSLMETAQPFITNDDPPVTGYETFSVKITGITRRFMFSGSIEPATESSSIFLRIPIQRIQDLLGSYSDLSFLGIGSGTIDVNMAAIESQTAPLASILRSGASKFNIIFNEGTAEMTYFVSSEVNSGDTMVPLAGAIANTSSTISMFPVVSDIYVDNFEGNDNIIMEMSLAVSPSTTVDNIVSYYGYADINLILKYGTPES